MNIDNVIGTHITTLRDYWGEPEKIGYYAYRWRERVVEEVSGHYITSSLQQDVYNTEGEVIGYIYVPVQKYVEPHTIESRCEVTVVVDERGLVADIGYDSGYLDPLCPHAFPLPPVKP